MSTHIRMAGEADYGIGTYCGAPPVETISLRHWLEGLLHGPPHRGHVDRLPAPLCTECVMREAASRTRDRIDHRSSCQPTGWGVGHD